MRYLKLLKILESMETFKTRKGLKFPSTFCMHIIPAILVYDNSVSMKSEFMILNGTSEIPPVSIENS